ncbi:hypothetical protein QCA50_019728 [Cerrena zonata]|uniref:Coatomer subunit gamma n=1 Tax=Cerrena zonata TaxID=2478898 RepID=A0AAW0FAN9_9APHY
MGAGTVESSSGGENVDRLIAKMTSLMDEITEDFKIVIIEAIENLALKFPSKHKKLVSFLTDLLRDDGSLQLKSSIVDALFDLIKFLPDESAKQLILMNLCEFIEDCEFTELSFAVVCGGEVSKNVKILLSRCLNDVDDEVRDRTALSLKLIDKEAKKLVVTESKFDLSALENKLTHYLNDEANFSVKFDINEVPVISNDELKSLEYNQKIQKLEAAATTSDEAESSKGNKSDGDAKKSSNDNANDLLKQQQYAQELSTVPEFADYGKLSKSTSTPIYLTDKENEFVVTVVKHFFIESNKLVLQFDITNTLSHLLLQDVSVIAQSDNELYQEDFIIPLTELKPSQTGTVYVSLSTPTIGDEELLAAFGNTLSYTNKEIIDEDGNVDPSDEGWSDEYQIEDLEITPGDFIIPLYNSNFTAIFDQLEFEDSSVVTISGVKSLENAVTKLTKNLNSLPLDGSDYVPSDATSHVLKLLGKDLWGGKVGVLVRLAFTGGKVVAKLQAKSETEGISSVIISGAN